MCISKVKGGQMETKRVWRTLLLDFRNIDIIKNVGQFSYNAYLKGYDAGIISYDNEKLPLLKRVSGLKIDYVQKKYGQIVDAVCYMLKNGRTIDILHTYHIKQKTLIPILVYKIINPNGKVWLDLDWNVAWAKNYEALKNGTISERIRFGFQKFVLCKCCTLVSSPATPLVEMAKQIYDLPKEKVGYVPCGYLDTEVSIDYGEKENIFLCVGRLGAAQKNVELLINAFCNVYNKQNWKLVLIGPADKKFLNFLGRKKKENDIENRISYIGEILDREELAKWYAKSKVFVLPSRFESFGIVLCEAMAQGCYLVASDGIISWKDISDDNIENGMSFKNNSIKDLSRALMEVIASPYLEYTEKRKQYVRKFIYADIINDVFKKLGI